MNRLSVHSRRGVGYAAIPQNHNLDPARMPVHAAVFIGQPDHQVVGLAPRGVGGKAEDPAGVVVPITLVFEDAAQKRFTQEIKAPVTALGGGNAPMPMSHGAHKH